MRLTQRGSKGLTDTSQKFPLQTMTIHFAAMTGKLALLISILVGCYSVGHTQTPIDRKSELTSVPVTIPSWHSDDQSIHPVSTVETRLVKPAPAMADKFDSASTFKAADGLADAYSLSGVVLEERRAASAPSSLRRMLDAAASRPLASADGVPYPQVKTSAYIRPTGRERFHRYLWDTIGPFSLVSVAAAAAIEQKQNQPSEWGQGASGYGKRYAAIFGQVAAEESATYGLSEAFRLDSGFHQSHQSGFRKRLANALLETVTARTVSGRRVIAAPRLVGAYTGGLVAAEGWYPDRFTYKDGLRFGTYSLGLKFGENILREFFFHH